jgi:hypothetical protein
MCWIILAVESVEDMEVVAVVAAVSSRERVSMEADE